MPIFHLYVVTADDMPINIFGSLIKISCFPLLIYFPPIEKILFSLENIS